MKKTICHIMLTLLIVSTLTLTLNIQPVQAQEPTLITILHTLGFINIIETAVETFQAGTYDITLLAEFTAAYDANKLSRYKVGTSEFVVIFTEPEGNQGYVSPPITKSFTINHEFGLSLKDETRPERFFTETYRNPDQIKHAIIHQILDDPSMFLIGFEDVPGGGDRDYQDMVISLKILGPSIIEASINIDPDILNLKSNGEFVTAYLELPLGYNVADIDLSTVQLEGIPAITDTQYGFVTDPASYLMDHDGDGILERMVKFDRATVQAALTNEPDYDSALKSYDLTLTVTGELVDGTPFEGSDTIRVLSK